MTLGKDEMKSTTSINKGLAAFLLGLGILAAACGGGSSSLGSNSDVELVVSSNDIEDMSVIVSPREGGPNASNACTEDDRGFGCDVDLYNDATAYYFRTDSEASSRPFHVYIRNFVNATRRGTLDIYMDDELDFSVGFEVFANETYFIARIFRNNADFATDRSVGREPRLLKGDAEKKAWIKGEDVGVPLTLENFNAYMKSKS